MWRRLNCFPPHSGQRVALIGGLVRIDVLSRRSRELQCSGGAVGERSSASGRAPI